MGSLISRVVLEPLLTGPLLWLLTLAPAHLQTTAHDYLDALPYKVEPATLITTFKWLFGLGVVRRVNRLLNAWSLNKWSIGESGAKFDYPNEIMVITGGSGGIGVEIIKNLAPLGMKVAILDLSPPGAALKDFKNVHFYKCDITDSSSVHSVAEKVKSELGNPSILVNNAGIGKSHNIIDATDAYLDKIFKINLISHWYTVREFLPGMIKQRKGHIVTTASMASFVTVAGMVDYCVTKAGTLAFHEGLDQELKHRYKAPFIKTTSVHPHWARTALVKDWVEKNLDKINHAFLTPELVGKTIAKGILSGKSGRIVLPDNALMHTAGILRGAPRWLQELTNDREAKYAIGN